MTPGHSRPTFLTAREVTALFRISRATFYRWVAEGRIEATRINGLLRIPSTEVDRLQRDYFE